jgi:hypothetical protein
MVYSAISGPHLSYSFGVIKTKVMLVILILARLLFIASMVFILGYVFGNFSKNARLVRVTKVAAVFLVISFIASNILFFRWNNGWRYGNYYKNHRFETHCVQHDSTIVK